ncbi:MAG: hypothetical protein JWL70_3084, partial [Acidimicrobiia bacterium]|nr:hypothetical protein [Acidimicrobiia bacterium]
AVNAGSLAPDLSVPAPDAAGLRRTDPARVLRAVQSAWTDSSVVLVEMSDLERVNQQRHVTDVSSTVDEIRRADALLEQLLGTVDPATSMVLLVAPAAPGDGAELTFFAGRGPNMHRGLASSGTTRRPGYVTLPDIAPTIVAALGVSAPSEMNGTPILASGTRQLDSARLQWLADRNTVAKFRDRAVGPVSVVFVVGQVLAYLFAAWILVGGRRRSALRPFIAFVFLVVLATPIIGFLSGVVRYDRLGIVGYTVAVSVLAVLLAALVWPLRYLHGAIPPMVLAAGNLLLQLVDVAAGGHLQIDTVFGYSPIVAGRFQGYGNLSFAIVAASALVLATAPLTMGLRGRPVMLFSGTVLALAVVADGAPFWGSDVGGALSLAPAAILVLMMLAGRKVNARRVLVAVVAAVALVSVFAAVDLARPASHRTHLGRFAHRILHGDINNTLIRKGEANLRILTSSVWTLLIPVVLAYLIFLARRPHGPLADVQRRVPALAACLVGSLVTGMLGFALNDSGIAIPAMMLTVVLPWVSWWAVRTTPEPP